MNSITANIVVESPVVETPRVQQVRGLFDLPEERISRQSWQVALPLHERPWHIGLVVGPSGSGKSTLARHVWPDALRLSAPDGSELSWSRDRCVLDDFPEDMPVKEVIELLSSVGFSSPPTWLRPFHVLSTGQRFRVLLARLLALSPSKPVVFDEYTSVVDRTVAQIGSGALAKTVRRRGQQFIALTCHEDVEPWLQPDWVYRPAENLFQWRCLQRRPAIEVDVFRCAAQAWDLFAPHHYLNQRLRPGAVCFLATWQDRPVAFSAWINHVGAGPPTRREHRTVTLPDYQGAGIGNVLSTLIASLWQALGYRARSTTTHPALIAARRRSSLWRMHRPPSLLTSGDRRMRHAGTRLTAGFTYIGPPLDCAAADRLLETCHGQTPTPSNRPPHSANLRLHPQRRLRTNRL
jgi:ABC-type transport system involved in cytochrome c biogenesis ATPase subunit